MSATTTTALQAKLTLVQLNALTAEQFVARFHNVIESWPQAAVSVADQLPKFYTLDAVAEAFQRYIDTLAADDCRQILRLHPDLAGRLAAEGALTPESTAEQQQAGLNALTPEHAQQMRELNEAYRRKFGFPFVICVRQTNRIEAILVGLRERLEHVEAMELSTGMAEVRQICRLRVEALLEL